MKAKTNGGRKVRYAVVGAGNIAQVAVLPAFRHAKENSELVALISSDAQKRKVLGEKYGVETAGYDALEDVIIAHGIDAVYVATPNAQHPELTERALGAGAHVLCEKPMAMTSMECESMNKAAARAGRKLMIAYRLHFEAATLTAIELATSGKLGDLKSFSADFAHEVREGDIRTRPELGGGALYDLGPYPVDVVRHVFEAEPIEVFAFQSEGVEVGGGKVDAMTTAVLRFANDRIAHFTVSQRAAPVSCYRIIGTKGDLRVEPAFEYVGPLTHHLTIDEKTTRRIFPARDQFAPELVYFSRCILEDRAPEPSGEQGLADVVVLEALARSATEHRPVALEPRRHPSHPTLAQEIHKPPLKKPDVVNAPSPTRS